MNDLIIDKYELVRLAKEKSKYYKEIYNDFDSNIEWDKFPIVDQKKFWEYNSWENNSLLTEKPVDGIVFKSGGTTGVPKFSIYNQKEWEAFTSIFGKGLRYSGLKKGDRTANLFYVGELYSSFVFIMKSFECLASKDIPIIQFPIAGNVAFDELLKLIKSYNINVLLGVPTSFVLFAQYLKTHNVTLKSIDKILFGGESLYDDQIINLKEVFPNALIQSIGHASVDGGHLGYFDSEICQNGEHVVFSDSSIMEIVDDNGDVITNPHIKGKLVYTNLTRRLMPIIRYPVGDMAEWTIVNKKYLLKGRSEEGARVGPVTINSDDLNNILAKYQYKDLIKGSQMVIKHFEKLDHLTVVLGVHSDNLNNYRDMKESFKNLFYSERKMFKDSVDKNIIHPVDIEIKQIDSLERNRRTGKMRLIIDHRQ